MTALAEGLAREGICVNIDSERVVPSAAARLLAPMTHRHEATLVEDDPESRDALAAVLEVYPDTPAPNASGAAAAQPGARNRYLPALRRALQTNMKKGEPKVA